MGKKPIIKIMTGKNGGSGKTTILDSIMDYHIITRNRKTCCLDWNLNNMDLIKMRFYSDCSNAKADVKENFFYRELKDKKSKKVLKFYSPVNPRLLQDNDFWEYLVKLYDLIKKETICCIDTRMNIDRIIPTKPVDLSPLKGVKIEFYYILGWVYSGNLNNSDVDNELQNFYDACEWIAKHIPNSEIIFVFNVNEQNKPKKLFYRKVGWSVYSEYEKRLKKAKSTALLTYKTLIKFMDKYSFHKTGELDTNDIPELWEPLFVKFLNLLKNKQVIRNWLLIPEKVNMSYTTDSGIVAKKGILKAIRASRQQLANYIKQFEQMRDKLVYK